MDKRIGPGERGWSARRGGELAGDDDVEGHAMLRKATDDETEGDFMSTTESRPEDQDTEGHRMLRKAEDDEDTEGHRMLRKAEDDEDTEGHALRR